MLKFDLGKYRNILISIVLFLLLDASVLVLNFYISFQISEDAVSINLAGRQRMLSQRMTKSLFDLDSMAEEEKVLNELQLSRNLFDETLTAFDEGGNAMGAGGSMVSLNRVDDTQARDAVNQGLILWSQYREKIDRVLAYSLNKPADFNEIQSNQLISDAAAFGRDNNLILLKLMNDLTVSLEKVASSKAQTLRLIQTAGILMALGNFFLILFHFIRQLRDGDKVVEAARRETTEILETVNEGLFLIHEDFSIGTQRSDELSNILNIEDKANINFDDLLKDIVSEKDLEASRGFLRLLFKPDVKEKLIGSLNPLEKIQVNIDDGSGVYVTKFLSFQFKRVTNDKNIVDVLVSVNDITENVLLERELNAAREKNENQINMLTKIIHVNPSLMKSYLENAFKHFTNINKTLKEPSKTQQQFQRKIRDIFVEVHNLKGESSALEMDEMVDMAHHFEEELNAMRNSDTVQGQEFLPLTVLLERMINYAQSISALIKKLESFNTTEDSQSQVIDDSQWDHLYEMTSRLSDEYQKQVMLVTTGLNEVSINSDLKKVINSICIQFIKNAIVHGIELPNDREESQKSKEGRIDIQLNKTPKNIIELIVRDDGAGIDYDKIRERAVSLELVSQQEIEGWDIKKLTSLIFNPGFSTADSVDANAGRGVGMDMILESIKQHRGKIQVSSRMGRYSQFTISFPLDLLEHEAA